MIGMIHSMILYAIVMIFYSMTFPERYTSMIHSMFHTIFSVLPVVDLYGVSCRWN